MRDFVSVVTPTYGRHAFLPWLIRMFNSQTYPQAKMELIILDDGPLEVSEHTAPKLHQLIAKQPNIRYIHHKDGKLNIGAKRNMLNRLAKGDYIVCMDDDDFYPPKRVEHAVASLKASGMAIAGSSEMHILFIDGMAIQRFGPYGSFHATNGTFAFTRKHADTHTYNEDVAFGEEASFTDNFTVPLKQLNPYDAILCIAHKRNTFDKSIIKDQGSPLHCKLNQLVKDKELVNFYKSLKALQTSEDAGAA